MAATGRIGSVALLNDTMRDVSASQQRLSDLQNQISSGYKSRDFEGLNGSVEQFTQINSQMARANQFSANNQVNIAKLQTADAAMSRIIDITDKLKNTIVGANSANIQSANLPQAIGDLLKSLGAELNTTFNGYYLFSGSDTIQPPVPDTGVINDTIGVPDDNYYAGAKQSTTFRVDDRIELDFPVRADDIAFQKVYAAARQAIAAAQTGDVGQMQAAQQLIQSGQTDLITARSHIGGSVNAIETVNTRLASVSTYWKELSESVSKTDIVAASTEVAGYQAILQASFQVYARLSQLKLSDYLK